MQGTTDSDSQNIDNHAAWHAVRVVALSHAEMLFPCNIRKYTFWPSFPSVSLQASSTREYHAHYSQSAKGIEQICFFHFRELGTTQTSKQETLEEPESFTRGNLRNDDAEDESRAPTSSQGSDQRGKKFELWS